MSITRTGKFMGVPDEFWIGFLIMVGVFLKLYYAISVDFLSIHADSGAWLAGTATQPGPGHIGVIQYYYTYHALPQMEPLQFPYFGNPPLFYIVAALIVDIFHRLFGWQISIALRMVLVFNTVFVLTGTSCGIAILRKFGVRGRKLVLCIFFLMYFPAFYNLSASLDPSAMAFMLTMLCMNTMLSWYHSRRAGTLTHCALQFGLAMMTSESAIILLPPLLLLMLHAHADGRRNHIPLGKQYVRFGFIAGVLSLWWPVYRLLRYHLPPFYIPASFGKRVDSSFFSRLLLPESNLLWHLHTEGYGAAEHNIWAQTFKTSVVDFHSINLSMDEIYILAFLAVCLAVAVFILSHVMLVRVLSRKRLPRVFRDFIIVGYAAVLVYYLFICWRYPYIGTMDFKRIAPVLIFPLVGIGLCGVKGGSGGAIPVMDSALSSAVAIMLVLLCGLSMFLFGFYM